MAWQDLLRGLVATHALLLLGAIISFLLLSSMLRQQRNPAASTAWLVFMVAIPYLGVPLYLLFGTRKLNALSDAKQQLFTPRPAAGPAPRSGLEQLLDTLQTPSPLPVAQVRFHRDADQARTALLDMLAGAISTIDISVYIFADDHCGRQVLDQLTRRARAGVRVRLLLDGVGSFYLLRKKLRPLLDAGGLAAWFIPVFHIPLRGRTNLRNHRKMVVVDGRRLWSGGRNIADDYLQAEASSHWVDLSFDLHGPAVRDYQTLFNADWAFATRQSPEQAPGQEPEPGVRDAHLTRLLPAGPDMRYDVIHDSLARLFSQARDRIVIVTPYFVPSETLQALLCNAARSGLCVDILMPANSNHGLADFTRQRFLRELHLAGAHIRLLPDAMLHAKCIVIDDRYALAGSANFDLRSLYLNFEMMTLFYDTDDIAMLQDWIQAIAARTVAWRPRPAGIIRQTLEGLVMITAFQL